MRFVFSALVAFSFAVAGCDDDDLDGDDGTTEELEVELEVDVTQPFLIDSDDNGTVDAEVVALRLDIERVELARASGALFDMDILAPMVDLMTDDEFDLAVADVPEARFDAVIISTGDFSEIEFDARVAPVSVIGGTDGIVLPGVFCVDDGLLDEDNDVEISLKLEGNVFFNATLGEFVIDPTAFAFDSAPEC
jgi:hypothetical protein